MSKLYIRKSYKDLYNYISNIFIDNPTMITRNRLIIIGTSGIGKSAFLVYAIIRLLALSNDNDPPIIIFHTKEGSECYAFGGTLTLRVGNVSDFEPFLYLPKTWYLVDSSPNPQLDSLAAKTLISGNNQCQEVKENPLIYYMAPWELDELKDCQVNIFTLLKDGYINSRGLC